MATTITYATALSTAIDFLESHDFDNKEVIEKLQKLADQKSAKANSGKKSVARKANDKIAIKVVDLMREKGLTEIRASWVRDNFTEVASAPRAVAVLNAAIDEGLMVREVVAKSATRNESVYKLAE